MNARSTIGFYARARRALIFGYAFVAAGLVGGATWYLLEDRAERFATATHNATTLARALDEFVSRTFNAADMLLYDIAADVAIAGGVPRVQPLWLHHQMRGKLGMLPHVRAMFLYGPDSMHVANTTTFPTPRVDGSHTEYVIAHRRNDVFPLYVGKPVIAAVSRIPSLPVTRRIPVPGDAFGGVIGAALDPNYFGAFYRDLGLSPGQGLALIRADGVLLFRYPAAEVLAPGIDLSTSMIFKEGLSRRTVGVVRFVSGVDGIERIIAFRQIPNLGIAVTLSQAVEEIVAPWRRNAALLAAGVAGALAALFVLVWFALRQLARRAADEQRIREANETLEENVRRRTAELESANRELEAFSYSVSHDLRAPLRAMAGFSAILRAEHAGRLDDEARALLARIEGGAQRMSTLIEALLGLAQVARQEMRVERVDLSSLAQELLTDLADASPERKVQTQVAPGLVAHADPALARIVLQNLLGNAWKYTAKTPQARIEFGQEQIAGENAFYVRDNGAGFEMEYAGQLFRPFQRLHSEHEYKGTGIGLATVERIVRRHGGRIWAEGAPDGGATFWFTLPAAR